MEVLKALFDQNKTPPKLDNFIYSSLISN